MDTASQRAMLLPHIIELKKTVIGDHNKLLDGLTQRLSELHLVEFERKKQRDAVEEKYRA